MAAGTTAKARGASRNNGSTTTTTTTNNNNNNSNNKNTSGDWSAGIGVLPGREMVGPLLLMSVTPAFSIVFWHLLTERHGDWIGYGREIQAKGFLPVLTEYWPTPWNPTVWQGIASYLLFQIVLMQFVPGKKFVGNVTPQGNRPIYIANGLQCYFLTLLTASALQYYHIFNLALVYDHYGELLSSLNVLSWALCAFLFVKGRLYPSSTDSGTTGSVLYDFYWGMELYPRVWNVDIKMLTNCRGGMMFWSVALLCFAIKNASLQPDNLPTPAILASVVIQLIYITKFFGWEMGYMCSMDIQHDRAGYYLCWGCLVWVPSVYTSPAMYLTENSTLNDACTTEWALLIAILGILCVAINYESDWQRYVFRQSHGTRYSFWYPTKQPKQLQASYTTATGQRQTSLLLLDGWWQYARHFHYIPEILASLCWTLPSGLDGAKHGGLPYFYVVYLTCLLIDRAYRDDDRCRKKYGADWQKYCNLVPYKIVPGLV